MGFVFSAALGSFSYPRTFGLWRAIFRLKVDYQGFNNTQYYISFCFGQLIHLGKVESHLRVAESGFGAVVHIFEQAGHLPEVFPFDAEIVRQRVQRRNGGPVFSPDDIVDCARAEPGIHRKAARRQPFLFALLS